MKRVVLSTLCAVCSRMTWSVKWWGLEDEFAFHVHNRVADCLGIRRDDG